MFEALVSLVWGIFKDRLEPRLIATVRRFLTPVTVWFRRLTKLSKGIVVASIVVISATIATLTASVAGRPVRMTARELVEASRYSESLPLSRVEREKLGAYADAWAQVLASQLKRQMSEGDSPQRPQGDTAWTMAQKALALEGMNIGEKKLDGKDILGYVERDVDPQCNCWRELERRDNRPTTPENVAISAWIIVTLARLNANIPSAQLTFLNEATLSSGAWPVLPSGAVEHGSTFSTPWVLLALSSIRSKATDQKQIQDLSWRISQGVDWLLDHQEPEQPWVLYPQWNNTAAQQPSLSNSGLIIFVLDKIDRSSKELPRNLVGRQWQDKLARSRRTLLRNLKRGIQAGTVEAYNNQVMTRNDGLAPERLELLVLPWLIMGSVDAYPSGSVTERVGAISFVEDFVDRLDAIDHAIRQSDSDWIIPEMLMATRYLSDPLYFRN